MMIAEFFESFREWVHITRRRKDSKKLLTLSNVESARISRPLDTGAGRRSDEFILRLEPALAEFMRKLRNLRRILANLIQLNEPGV